MEAAVPTILDVINKYGVLTGVALISFFACGWAMWKVYNRMADAQDKRANEQDERVQKLMDQAQTNHEKHMQDYQSLAQAGHEHIRSSTEVLTKLVDRLDIQNRNGAH